MLYVEHTDLAQWLNRVREIFQKWIIWYQAQLMCL